MRRTLSLFILVCLLALTVPSAAWACEHCFGANVDSQTTRGIALAMGALLGFTGLVASGVLSFFRKLNKRARALEAGDLAVSEYGELVEQSSPPLN